MRRDINLKIPSYRQSTLSVLSELPNNTALKIQLPQLPRSIFSCSLGLHGSSDSLPVMTTFLYNLVCFLEEQGMVKWAAEQVSLRMRCELGLVWCVSATAACNFSTVHVLEDSCWGLAFWRRSPNQYDPRSKNTQEEKKRQVIYRIYLVSSKTNRENFPLTGFRWATEKTRKSFCKISNQMILSKDLKRETWITIAGHGTPTKTTDK